MGTSVRRHRGPGSGRSTWWVVAGGTVGGAVGLGIGAASYLVINPLLEGTGTWIEELQGLAWNLVPAGAIFGIVAGALIAVGLRTRR